MNKAQPQGMVTRDSHPVRAWRHWAGLCLAFVAVACLEGYGTEEDEALVLSHGMSLEEVLRAMNRIGEQKRLRYEWHYQLHPGCVLVVEAKRLFRGREPISVPLMGKEAVILKEEAADQHEVVVRTQGSPSAPGTIVFASVNRMQAVQMKWLIEYAPRHCPAGQGLAE